MTAAKTFAQRSKRELDLQLDEELEGTFPASDPPKITRFSTKSRGIADQQRKSAAVRMKTETAKVSSRGGDAQAII